MDLDCTDCDTETSKSARVCIEYAIKDDDFIAFIARYETGHQFESDDSPLVSAFRETVKLGASFGWAIKSVHFLARYGDSLTDLLIREAGQECPGHKVLFL